MTEAFDDGEHGGRAIAQRGTRATETLPDSGIADVPLGEELLVRQVGRYDVLRRLGAGSMGVVYLARDPALDREVALKFLNTSRAPADVSGAEARLRREARAMARLRHRNIVSIHECGTHEGRVFLAMEYVEGEIFGDWLKRRGAEETPSTATHKLSPAHAVRIALELFAGLEHAHDNGVVHRDLKPENIFIRANADGEEHIFIADFGVAKITAGVGSSNVTQSGAAIGTPIYMSPEQACGTDIDARTDLFSAGLILMRLLTGAVPLCARSALDQIRVRASRNIPLLPDVYPAELRSLCADLCERSREARLGTAREARKRLEAMQERWADEGVPWDEPVAPTSAYLLDAMHDGIPAVAESGVGASVEPLGSADGEDTEPEERPAVESEAMAAVVDAPSEAVPVAHVQLDAAPSRGPGLAIGIAVAVVAAVGLFVAWPTGPASAPQTPQPKPKVVADPGVPEAPPRDLPPPAVPKTDGPPDTPGPAPQSVLEQLAAVNQTDPDAALPYPDRHKLLRELEGNDKAAPYIDHGLNLRLDLLQAAQAETPCEVFGAALTAIEASGDDALLLAAVEATMPAPEGAQCSNALRRRFKSLQRRLNRKPKRPKPKPTAAAEPKPAVEPKPAEPEPRTPSAAHPVPVTEKLDG